MKRYIVLIGAILLNYALQAQSETYMCRYWFDQNHMQATTSTFSQSIWQTEIDIGSLSEGLHTLSLQLCDTSLVWNTPKSHLFYKVLSSQPALTYHYWFDDGIAQQQSGNIGNNGLLLDVDALDEGLHLLHIMLKGDAFSVPRSCLFYKVAHQQEEFNVIYRCWFDQDVSGLQSNALENGHFLLDVSHLGNGIHTVNIALQKNQILYSTKSYMFLKVEPMQVDSTDLNHLIYHCWFDQDVEHCQTDSLQDGHLLLDVDGLGEGLHTVNIMLDGSALNVPKSYMFMKLTAQDSTAETQYRCWFDNDYSTLQTGLVSSSIFEIDVEHLSNGIHFLNLQLSNGSSSVPKSYMFYKKPNDGYIAKWSYWLNDDLSNRHTTNLSPFVDTMTIITLLPLESWPIRSTCFHFQPNGDNPYLNAKNEITFRFWDAEYHTMDKSTYYVDENVSETIIADTLERNTTVSIDAPRDNTIKWYKLPLQFGDSVAFMADKACTMQLFSPSGEEVYSAKASESLAFGGCHAFEDGMYYLAIHDVTGSGEMISITYNWVYRYSILDYDVHFVGNGGCSTITFQGNGFNSLLDAYLMNAQNDTIRSLDIGHESNTTTTVSLNFYQENLGAYDAVFEFFEETIRINGALEVQEPVDILLTSTVSYPSQFLRNTPCTYTYTITNNGNMSAYAVPIYVYLSTNTMDGISLIEFDGIKLPSLIDGVDLDTLSPSRIEELKEVSDIIGDIHQFFIHNTIDEETGDSIIVWSNFFFLDFAPFETKTLTLKITSSESLDVWMTIPNEIVPPLSLHPDREWFGSWCCVKDNWTCLVDLICGTINIVNLVSQLFPGSPAHIYSGVASCICGIISMGLNIFSAWKCEGEGSFVGMAYKIKNSIPGAVASCVSCFIPSVNKEGAIIVKGLVKNLIASLTSAVSGAISVDESCTFEKKKKPNCPSGDSNGGKSDAVNSLDPNDIYGYLSESGSHYMRQEIQNVQYEIEFENDTTLATAAAHTIIVRDTLDAAKFDLNSLAARSVTIGDKRLDLNGEQTFARTLDLRPEIYVIAQVNQDYDPTTGIIQWTIQSLDPMTMEPTDDPNQGVLPVNYYGDGVGFIDYSINLKEAFDDGTEISNRAGIIFDQEEVIMTPIWTNIVDAVKPTSHIEEVTPVADSLSFSFVSEDNRSGVWYHSLYYRNDSTQMEWQVKKPQIIGNTFMLPIDSLQTTEYLVKAVDSAGNVEDKAMVAEYIYYSVNSTAVTQTTDFAEGWNWWSTYIDQTGIDGLTMLEEGLGNNGITIKSQGDGFVQFMEYGGYGFWYGTLDHLANAQTYLVQTTAPCQVEMTGVSVSPSHNPITISEGWNWIGYPSTATMDFGTAFAGITPTDGDIVKSQNSFAQYMVYGEYSFWYGELSTGVITPGMGIMYKSGNNESFTFNYPVMGRAVSATEEAIDRHWTNNVHAYPTNMTMLAVVELDDTELHNDSYELAAFANGECRGSAKLMYVAPLNRYMAFLTIAGDEAAELHFGLYENETGTEYYDSSDILVYSTDATIGSYVEPMVISFSSATGLGDIVCNLRLYPNPVARGERFSINLPVGSEVRVDVVNALGAIVSTKTSTKTPASFLAPNTAGIYTLRITVESEGTYCRKLVVE